MTSSDIYILENLSKITFNKFYIDRYIKLIDHYKINNSHNNIYVESHHILPQSLFPELTTSNFNKINLLYKAHFLAHWFLAKGTQTPEMIYAFNGMCNRNKHKHIKPSAILYAKGKQMFSDSQKGRGNASYQMVSAWNKQLNIRVRITSEEFYSNRAIYGGITCKEALQWKTLNEGYVAKVQGDRQKNIARLSSINTAPSKNIITGENLGRISKDDPRWITGEIISSCIGARKAKRDRL